MEDLKADLVRLAKRQGFVEAVVARAEPNFEARDIIVDRIRDGSFSGLPWFDERRAIRATDPRASLDGAESVVLLAASYANPTPARDDSRLRGRIARYAWGRDYHRVLEKRARPLVALIAERVPGAASRVVVDHAPLAERVFARAAGLGWQGKNTMLLARGVGSYTFLAAILTTATLEPDSPIAQHCGSCARCLPACPTGALRAEYELVNDLCIAHQTIENRGVIPRALRPQIGDWVFGCDLCQEACPVNEAASVAALDDFAAASPEDAHPDLLSALEMPEQEFRERFAGRPILRAKYAGFLRNVCVALGNLGDQTAIAALVRALAHREPLVRGHAAWALGRLRASDALHARRRFESDPWVIEEIDAALEEAGG
jgi:epoxyqueuosine reductase